MLGLGGGNSWIGSGPLALGGELWGWEEESSWIGKWSSGVGGFSGVVRKLLGWDWEALSLSSGVGRRML